MLHDNTHSSRDTIEADIERHLRDIAQRHDVLCIKAISSAHNGIPDRILVGKHAVTSEGITAFVEVKRPGGTPRALQRHVIADLVRHGAIVAITDSVDTNIALMRDIFGIDV